jgi:hypothetical protein
MAGLANTADTKSSAAVPAASPSRSPVAVIVRSSAPDGAIAPPVAAAPRIKATVTPSIATSRAS